MTFQLIDNHGAAPKPSGLRGRVLRTTSSQKPQNKYKVSRYLPGCSLEACAVLRAWALMWLISGPKSRLFQLVLVAKVGGKTFGESLADSVGTSFGHSASGTGRKMTKGRQNNVPAHR